MKLIWPDWLVRVWVPVTEPELERGCTATSGWDGLWLWRTGICWPLDIPCWTPSAWLEGASRGCWEGAEAVGRWGGRIFSAISCSLILLIKTRLSSWQPENNVCDKRTAISSVGVTVGGDGSLCGLTNTAGPSLTFLNQQHFLSLIFIIFSVIRRKIHQIQNPCSIPLQQLCNIINL